MLVIETISGPNIGESIRNFQAVIVLRLLNSLDSAKDKNMTASIAPSTLHIAKLIEIISFMTSFLL